MDAGGDGARLFAERCQYLIVGFRKGGDAVHLQSIGNGFEIDPESGQSPQLLLRLPNVFEHCGAPHLPVLPKGFECVRRNSIHSIGTD